MTTEAVSPEHWHFYIGCNPEVLVGKPTIIGTRISVEQILGMLAGGHSVDEILTDAFPHLKREQILACIAYGRDLVRVQPFLTKAVIE